jgi:hypothetical protein
MFTETLPRDPLFKTDTFKEAAVEKAKITTPQSPNYTQMDRRILAVTGKLSLIPHIDALEIFGSSRLRSEYAEKYEPIWKQLLQKGRITPEVVESNRQALKDGELRLFFQDLLVGLVTNHGLERLALPGVPALMSYLERPELTIPAIAGSFFINPLAVPYFGVRSAWELKHLAKQVKGGESPGWKKALQFSQGALMITSSVVVNLVPVASILATPMLTFARYKKFSSAMVGHSKDNFIESCIRFADQPPGLMASNPLLKAA